MCFWYWCFYHFLLYLIAVCVTHLTVVIFITLLAGWCRQLGEQVKLVRMALPITKSKTNPKPSRGEGKGAMIRIVKINYERVNYQSNKWPSMKDEELNEPVTGTLCAEAMFKVQ